MQLDPTWLAEQGEDARLLTFVARGFSKHKPRKVGVAVSGGGDSKALLDLAARWASNAGLPLLAVTVDHGLREEASTEAADVAAFCASLNVPHTTLEWRGWDGHGNLQAAARDARYRLIGAWAEANGVDVVALGHTKNDTAETFLMRLARKAGIDGLATSDVDFERAGVTWTRPLWLAGRDDLRGYLKRRGLSWIDDPSNDDLSFDRVRLRNALNVLSENGIGVDVLHHAAYANREARDALEYYAAKEAADVVRQDRGDLVMPYLLDAPPEIGRRLRSKAIQWVGQLDYPPRQAAMEHLVIGLSVEGTQTLGGCVITRKGGDLRITREQQGVFGTVCKTDEIWDNRWRLDGPHAPDLQIRALGEGIRDCPDWRSTDMPRVSLLASPAVWRGETLLSAPLAGYSNGWTARIVADFHSYLLAH